MDLATGCVPCAARWRMLITSSSLAPQHGSCGPASARRSADNGATPTSLTFFRRSTPPPLATEILDGCASGFSPGHSGPFATSLLFRKCLSDVRLTRSSKCVVTCSSGDRLAAPRTGTSSIPSSPTFARWRSAWHPRCRPLLRSPTRLVARIAVCECVVFGFRAC